MVAAISITSAVLDWLASAQDVRLYQQFAQVWNLVDGRDRMVSLVTPAIGNGPFHVVIACDTLPPLSSDEPIVIHAHRIRMGCFTIDLRQAVIWNPVPSLNRHLPLSRRIAICQSVLILPKPDSAFEQMIQERLTLGTSRILDAIDRQDRQDLIQSVRGVAGQGTGLTPAGDDWLLGCIIALHLRGRPDAIDPIVDTAAPQTTLLSAQWLQAARTCKLDVHWHQLLQAPSPASCHQAAQAIVRRGATSGTYALVGFVQTLAVLSEM